MVVAAAPLMSSIGARSNQAFATPVSAFTCAIPLDTAQTPGRPLDEMVTSFETSVIEPLLRAYGADTAGKRKVAERLGISLATLYRKLRNS